MRTAPVRVNGVDSAVTCTIAGAVATTCTDTTNSVAVPAGATVTIHSAAVGGPANQEMGWTARFQ